MNRTDFMTQLERLLQGISSAEREEALQYYNDYFDDAGKENEQAVIEALGNPARVAENIRRDLADSGPQPRAKASDKAIVEYGRSYEEESRQEEETAQNYVSWQERTRDAERQKEAGNRRDFSEEGRIHTSGGGAGRPGEPGRSLAGWAIILIVIGAVFASPVALGVLSVLFGIAVCWLAVIFSFGVVALSMFILLVCFVAVGIMCMFTDPLVGTAMIGGGLVCGGVGLLFLMLTVALAGIVTPAVFRGIAWLFKGRKREAGV